MIGIKLQIPAQLFTYGLSLIDLSLKVCRKPFMRTEIYFHPIQNLNLTTS